eukprot:2360045-Amphidinium_carterae.2
MTSCVIARKHQTTEDPAIASVRPRRFNRDEENRLATVCEQWTCVRTRMRSKWCLEPTSYRAPPSRHPRLICMKQLHDRLGAIGR